MDLLSGRNLTNNLTFALAFGIEERERERERERKEERYFNTRFISLQLRLRFRKIFFFSERHRESFLRTGFARDSRARVGAFRARTRGYT